MNTRLTLIAVGLVLSLPTIGILSGCTTTNAYTGQQQVSKTAVGAGVGAVGGAIIGAITGDSKGALIGAGVGALAGGAVGNYMDREEAALRQQLQGTGVQVARQGNTIKLIMPGDISFARNSSNISSSFYQTLNSVAIVLNKFNKNTVKVAGFTSNTGSASYNQQLSERRAQSVANYLISQRVASHRIMAVGYGLRYPIASNSTARGRALNRRVEITLNPIT